MAAWRGEPTIKRLDWPNDDTPINVGDYVFNCHPLGHRDEGVVLQSEAAGSYFASVLVRTGRGSTCYGPTRNWRPLDRKPLWLTAAEGSGASGF